MSLTFYIYIFFIYIRPTVTGTGEGGYVTITITMIHDLSTIVKALFGVFSEASVISHSSIELARH